MADTTPPFTRLFTCDCDVSCDHPECQGPTCDFEEELHEGGPACWLEPAAAEVLWHEAQVYADMLGEDAEFGVEELPPLVRASARESSWYARWAATARAWKRQLADGRCEPRTTAEEMMLHILIRHAEDAIHDGMVELEHGDAPTALRGLDEARDLAFEDHDVLMLFDPALDGIEDSDVGQVRGMANLKAKDWFDPFRDPVPPFEADYADLL